MTKNFIYIIALIISVNSYYTYGQNQIHPLVGDATLVSSDCYELTSETPYVMGAIWFDPQLDLNEDFDIRVTLNFGSIFQWDHANPGGIYPEAGGGADGIAFVLQQTSSAAGDVGEALGYGLLDSSLAVEFDPYYNFNADPIYDHVAVSKNGNHIHTQSPYGDFSEGVIIPGQTIVPALGTDPVLDNIHTGLDYEARFLWDAAAHELDVWFNCQHKFTFSEDLVNTIFEGNSNVYYGFTAATGAEYNLHKVCVSYNSQQFNLQNDTICSGQNSQLNAMLLNSDPNETSYSWFPTVGLSDPNIANPIASPMSTTTYVVTIQQSCYADPIVDSLTVFVNNSMPLTIDSVGTLCMDQEIIVLTANSLGGTWDGNGILDVSIGNFSPAIAGVGIHEIIYSTTGDCGGIDTLYIDVFDVPTVSFTANTLYGCSPLIVTFNNTVSDGVSCVWDFGDGTVLTGSGPFTHTFTGSDCFDVSLSVEANGCIALQTETDLICLTPPPSASFSYSPSGLLTAETEVQFINTSVNANYYLWNFYNTQTSLEVSPNHTFSSGENLNYEVCLTAFLDSMCFDTYCTNFEVENEFYFYVPNAFTPDGDRSNNYFGPCIIGANIENYEFIIFNRWGELIFKTSDLNTFWNGEYKGHLCQDGVYIWKISLKHSNKTVKTIGHVSLLH